MAMLPSLILFLFLAIQALAYDWHDAGSLMWAERCDWKGNDLSSAQVKGEQCGPKCESTQGCTHFTWTGYQGGTCWMKKNGVNPSDAFPPNEYSVCGYMKSAAGGGGGGGGGGGATAKGTMWADQTDPGGCQMPKANYRIQNALALGQSPELGNLVWRHGLCGQVIKVDCGSGPVEAVVASTCNLGSGTCGVDMIRKTWNQATGGKPPGEARCNVQLTNTNPMNDATPVCYTRPDSGGLQLYYVSLGVFNTNGRVVKSAVAAGVQGKFQSGSGYLDFDAQGQPKFGSGATVVFNFEDGSNASFRLGDCKNGNGVYIWK